jgi:hypothetical protein
MDRGQVSELHYIVHIDNIASILSRGILSHNRAATVKHTSVAMEEIQERRAVVAVPGGLKLHDYVNLYLTARNPMLFKRREMHESLLVARVSPDVLDIQGVVITDRNAAGEFVAFLPSPSGLALLDYDRVFARYWTDDDLHAYWRKKASKCAEVLVPHVLPAEYIMGAHASCSRSVELARSLVPSLAITLNPDLFFL